jgi:hypothetical protein
VIGRAHLEGSVLLGQGGLGEGFEVGAIEVEVGVGMKAPPW